MIEVSIAIRVVLLTGFEFVILGLLKSRVRFGTNRVKILLSQFRCKGAIEILWYNILHIKYKVYLNIPSLIQDLEYGIRKAIEGKGQPLCHLVMLNFMNKLVVYNIGVSWWSWCIILVSLL